MDQEKVIVIDFGGQYNQLVARRVRECNVYCEIYSYKTDLEQIKAMNPKGIILTGGPNSCYEEGAPTCTKELFELGVPVLGLCYGAQLMSHVLGGKVEKGETFPRALIRECQEELAITLDVGEQFMQVVHRYPDILIRLTLFHCTIAQGIPKLLEHNDMRWIHPSEVDSFDFCPADTDILEEIKRKYGSRPPL